MKKNSHYLNLYKAYKSWKESIENDRIYKNYIKSLNNEKNGQNVLQGVIGKKDIDLTWVKQIEDALPYMDNAIREARSFIEQKDEIVNIEKVKRVNTQSIRHLAQHTNLIAKVEDNGDVLPSKILNIYYESNVAIYENRFIYTLLLRLSEFIEDRYQALASKDEKIEINYQIEKSIKRKQKTSKVKFEFDFKTDGTVKKTSTKDDTSKMSGFARIVRIRSIIQDFFGATLIKDLKGIQEVRSPIIRTNLMSKNTNFRTCLELWEFIERYRGPGYTYQNTSYEGTMPAKIKDDLNDIVVFGNFLTEITFNSEHEKNLKKELKEHQKEENQQKKQEILQLVSDTKTHQRQIENKKLERARESHNKKMLKIEQRLINEKAKNKLRQEKNEAKFNKSIQFLKNRNQSIAQKNKDILQKNKDLQQEKRQLKKQKRELSKLYKDLEKQQKLNNKKVSNETRKNTKTL